MNYVTGETIKNLREKKRITQKELADMINVSDKTISKWETQKVL
jgi:transcriptional regulator with XRE-family HTH domain